MIIHVYVLIMLVVLSVTYQQWVVWVQKNKKGFQRDVLKLLVTTLQVTRGEVVDQLGVFQNGVDGSETSRTGEESLLNVKCLETSLSMQIHLIWLEKRDGNLKN